MLTSTITLQSKSPVCVVVVMVALILGYLLLVRTLSDTAVMFRTLLINKVSLCCGFIDLSVITVFAWEAYEHGTDVHTLADPTKLELMHKQFKEKKKNFKSDQQQSILEKYGGEEHLDAPPKELLMAQTV